MKYKERYKFSIDKITEIKDALRDIKELKSSDDLCIYSTGSYARLEACPNSDLDLFFICREEEFSSISKTLIDAELIKLNRKLEIPEFSGDGKYLEVHSLKHIMDELGSQEDDYKNFFTARLLLLLESSPIFNEPVYEDSLNQIIESYYRDFHRHNKDFQPIFLANDIVRFWKTMTINYEHKRNRSSLEIERKSRVKNLKLKFSRKLTCFSFLIKILDTEKILDQQNILDIVKLTPIGRLNSLENKVDDKVRKVLEMYDWFLEKTSHKKDDLITWLDDTKNRDLAFGNSRKFGDLLFDILKEVDTKDFLKYLVI